MASSSTGTVSTRIMVISDTHNYKFDDAAAVSGAFVRPIPRADVLLHCGDLTQVGGASAYKEFLQMMAEIPAELKLVIAGNHDLDLDKEYENALYRLPKASRVVILAGVLSEHH
jgi:predicted phosphodiesterase